MGTWIVASALLERPAPAGAPYPCLCEQPDPDPPEWKVERARRSGDEIIYLCDPYLAKKGRHAGTWQNRCPCWGRPRIDERIGEPRPDGCCAWSIHNPAYAPTSMRGIDWRRRHGEQPGDQHVHQHPLGDPAPGLPIASPAGRQGPGHPSQPPRPGGPSALNSLSSAPPSGQHADAPPVLSPPDGDLYDNEWDYSLDPGPDDHRISSWPRGATSTGPGFEPRREPYVRRWSPEQVTCPCATPWDHLKDSRQFGHHCSGEGCHQNFKSQRAAMAHQPSVTARCKDPSTMKNVDGLLVYRATMVGGFVIWA